MSKIMWISMIPACVIYLLVVMSPHIPAGFFKNNWFKVSFASCSAFFFFWIIDEATFWKLLGAAMGFGFGWLVSKLWEKLLNIIKKTTVVNVIKIILCVLLILLAFIVGYGRRTYKSPYDDVFDKNPNHWTDDEKDHVNDFFEWMDDN